MGDLRALTLIAMALGMDDTLPKGQVKGTPLRIDPKLLKPGRNKPCLCGSGRKYKICCLPKE